MRNVIIYGLKEDSKEVVSAKVEEVLAEIDEKPIIRDCCRRGSVKEESICPIKFTLSSADMVQQVLRKARQLRFKDQYKFVYIFPDRTFEEREAFRKQREDKIKQKKEEQQRSDGKDDQGSLQRLKYF